MTRLTRRPFLPPDLQQQVYDVLDPDANPPPVERALNLLLTALIAVNVAAVVLASIPDVQRRYHLGFHVLELFSLGVFTVEYLGRVWVAPLKPGPRSGWRARVHWILSPLGLIDLGVLLALALPGLGGFTAFRSVRLLKLISILKFGRYSGALSTIGRVMASRRDELITTLGIVFVLVLMSATALYNLEGGTRGFETIPQAMWWSIVSLTTVGYGDVTPVTPLGRLIAGFVMVLGIGVVALPAGLIASGFHDELARKRLAREAASGVCPTCLRPHAEPAAEHGPGPDPEGSTSVLNDRR
ncbi:ion transporter [Deinococcus sonorensis]|uniref:Ion transporter n=2 Tax=Deinococcus sonorensis TaxID=309891 RepID=A0AAU7U6T4_9DEIO